MAESDLSSARLEAFSDGVIAIIVTIMVLELKPPHAEGIAALLRLWPIFAAYAASFVFVAIYWVNHRHLFHRLKRADNPVLWANMALLFFLSLIPFATAYLGEHINEPLAAALYAGLMLVCGVSFFALSETVARGSSGEARFDDFHSFAMFKNLLSLAIYAAAIPAAWVSVWLSLGLVVAVAGLYFLPEIKIGRVKPKG